LGLKVLILAEFRGKIEILSTHNIRIFLPPPTFITQHGAASTFRVPPIPIVDIFCQRPLSSRTKK